MLSNNFLLGNFEIERWDGAVVLRAVSINLWFRVAWGSSFWS